MIVSNPNFSYCFHVAFKKLIPKRAYITVDDHNTILTDAIAALATTPHIEIVGTADTLAACRTLLARRCPQVMVLDIALPDGEGIAFIPEIRFACPEVAALVLTSLPDRAPYRGWSVPA